MKIGDAHISRAFDYYSQGLEDAQTFEQQCELVNVDVTAAMKLLDVISRVVKDNVDMGITMGLFIDILAQREAYPESVDGGKSGT